MICISVTMFLTAVWVAAKRSEFYGTILAIPTASIVLFLCIAYPSSLTIRDMLERGQWPLRFRTSQLLWMMTASAIVLGILVFMLKHS